MTLSIKDHIEKGHYPKDDKGRAEVPTEAGSPITIVATDGPGQYPIVGFGSGYTSTWGPLGQWSGMRPDWGLGAIITGANLLPPQPRKRELKVWAIVAIRGGDILSVRLTPPAGVAAGIERLVELTGSYDEEWPA